MKNVNFKILVLGDVAHVLGHIFVKNAKMALDIFFNHQKQTNPEDRKKSYIPENRGKVIIFFHTKRQELCNFSR